MSNRRYLLVAQLRVYPSENGGKYRPYPLQGLYLNPKSRQNNSPKPLKPAQKPIILHAVGIQVLVIHLWGSSAQTSLSGLWNGFRSHIEQDSGLRI